jgi:hypothetical protein
MDVIPHNLGAAYHQIGEERRTEFAMSDKKISAH